MAASSSSIGYVDLLRGSPSFRRLWLAEVSSFAGDWFNTIALFAAVEALSDSAQAIAGVMVAKMLPPFLVTPLAGPIIDRFERRRLLVLTDVIRAACTVGLVLCVRADSLVGLYVCTVVLMAASGLAMPTKNAVLPMIVPGAQVATANALSGGTWSVMLALGATLGGLATELFGIEAAFWIDGATFGVSALLFAGLPELAAPGRARDGGGFVEGLRYLLRTPYILAVTCAKPMMGLLGGVLVLLPIYGLGVFPLRSGPFWVGILYAARGTGALIGALAVRVVLGDEPRVLRRGIGFGFAVAAVGYTVLGAAESLWVAAGCFLFAALGTSCVWVFSGTLLQIEADRTFHGRVFSLEFGVMTLIMAASSWMAGAGLDLGLSVAATARIGAALATLSAVAWFAAMALFSRDEGSR